jgi:CheY-like chemotaxis protein
VRGIDLADYRAGEFCRPPRDPWVGAKCAMATILIVEDDPAWARITAYLLRRAGHTPVLALTGRAALQEARTCPDLILLDLRLPDMSGGAVLRHLRGEPATAQIPVVVMTGQPDAAAELVAAGIPQVAAVLHKPVSADQLGQTVATVLAASRRRR